MGTVVPRISGASADWVQSRQEIAAQAPIGCIRTKKFAWATLDIRPFGTFSAKQRRSSLLFMLKSNKNLEPVSLWVPNLRTRGKGHKVSLSKPFPADPKGYGERRRRCACNLSSKVEALLSNPIYDSDFFRLISEIRVKNILLFSMDFFQPIHLKKYPK